MVKLDDIPEEEARLELDKLQDFMDEMPNGIPLMAIDENVVGDTVDDKGNPKVGGINISYSTPVPFTANYDLDKGTRGRTTYPDGLKLTQKYSKVSGKALKEAMQRLGLSDTAQLGKAYYLYRLRGFRVGFPRLIPFEKSDIEV